MTLVRLFPEFEAYPGLSTEDQSWLIAKSYGICNGWRINFAVNQSGESFGLSGASADVSGELDRSLLGKLRSLSDVIVTSGATARAEKYKSSKHAPIAIFTNSGDLDAVPAIQGTQYFTPIVISSAAHSSDVQDQLADVDALVSDYPTNVQWPVGVSKVLQHEGFQSPILEAGLNSLRAFVAAGVIDEICLTVTRMAGAGLSARQLSQQYLSQLFGDVSEFELVDLFATHEASFSRWRRGNRT